MSAVGRITAYLARLEWRGILAGLRPAKVTRQGLSMLVELQLEVDDSERPGERWTTTIVARLRDDETDEVWTRRLLEALADALGHELGEALLLDGKPVASPHERPRIWPWRATDRSEA